MGSQHNGYNSDRSLDKNCATGGKEEAKKDGNCWM